MESFAFGMPVKPLVQNDRGRKRVFVLGVYASAVHARWVDANGKTIVKALAVASEPEIFWCGDREEAKAIISKIPIPAGAGGLLPASEQFNGPSGNALNKSFLSPLGITRAESWLCDLVPLSRKNERQTAALARSYDLIAERLGLPAYHWPPVSLVLATAERRAAIEREIHEASPEIIITLGDLPLKWFTRHYGSKQQLSGYGVEHHKYGRLHPIQIADRKIQLLPLVHPRQAAGLGVHSSKWADLHKNWVSSVAGSLLGVPA